MLHEYKHDAQKLSFDEFMLGQMRNINVPNQSIDTRKKIDVALYNI